MNVALCDDHTEDLSYLVDLLDQYSSTQQINFQKQLYHNAEELMADEKIYNCDIIFLDIYMNTMSGMECAYQLKQNGYRGGFIFTTSSREHVFESFQVDVIDYIVKPFLYDRFCQGMNKAIKKYHSGLETITVMSSSTPIVIPVSQLCYIETSSHYSIIHTTSSIIRSNTPMSKLEELLSVYHNFLRCHRSYLVNMNEISVINDTTMTMSNGDSVLLSVRNIGKLKQQISRFMWSRAKEGLS